MNIISDFQSKADDAPTLFRVLAAIVERKLSTAYPQVMVAPHWSDFMRLFVFAGCHALAMRLHFEIAEKDRTPTEKLLQAALRRYDSEALDHYASCHNFVTEALITIPRAQRPNAVFVLHALWLLACITDEKRLEEHEVIAAFLGGLFQDETSGYWTKVS